MYRSNLCLLPVETQQAIETDKQRWLYAHEMIRTKPMNEIKAYIESIKNCELKEDMRTKLNQCYRNQNGS